MSTDQSVGCPIRWIGLANVRPLPGNGILGNAKGALVAVVGDAEETLSFLDLVERELRTLEFEVLSLDDVEPLHERMTRQKLPDELAAAIEHLPHCSAVALGSFHAYEE